MTRRRLFIAVGFAMLLAGVWAVAILGLAIVELVLAMTSDTPRPLTAYGAFAMRLVLALLALGLAGAGFWVIQRNRR